MATYEINTLEDRRRLKNGQVLQPGESIYFGIHMMDGAAPSRTYVTDTPRTIADQQRAIADAYDAMVADLTDRKPGSDTRSVRSAAERGDAAPSDGVAAAYDAMVADLTRSR